MIPRALGDVLDYLGGLGYDHLYLSQPSKRAEQRSQRVAGSHAPTPSSAGALDPAISSPPAPTSSSVVGGGAKSVARVPNAGSSTTALTPEERFTALDVLCRTANSCTACGLSKGRQNVVFASGQPSSRLMFIGEGPGSEEDRKGIPFVGPAGALLNRIIEAIGFRREDVYVANMVKCRPPRNRDPKPEEITACRGYIEEQIDLVAPKAIVILGRVAAQGLLASTGSLGSMRGRWHQLRGVPTRVTYHPAALLRNEAWKRPTWEDFKIVRDRLGSL